VLVFLKHFTVRNPTAVELSVAVVVSFVLAWLSWRFVERPFHTPPAQRRPTSDHQTTQTATRTTLKTSGWAIAILIAAGLTVDQLDGVPQRLPEQVARIASFVDDKPAERKSCSGKSPNQIRNEGLCKIVAKQTLPAAPDYLVWGDSHAMVLIPTFAEVGKENNRVGLSATSNGCPPMRGAYRPESDPNQECVAFNEEILNVIEQTPSITSVILIARWAIYLEGTRYKNESGKTLQLIDEQSTNASSLESTQVARRALGRTLARLKQLGKAVTIIASAPEIGWDTPTVLAKSTWRQRDISIAPSREEHEARQQSSTQLLAELADASIPVLNPATLLCPDKLCRVQKNGDPLYVDEDHLSSAGTRELTPLVRQALAKTAQADF